MTRVSGNNVAGTLENRPAPGYYLLTTDGKFIAPDDRRAFETADDAVDAQATDEIVVEVIA